MMSDQRGAFEKWARERWGSHAYLHTSNTSGEWDAWQAALTQPQAQQPQERDPSGIYQISGSWVACVVDARIPGTYQSWLGARLALALPDDVLIDLLNKAAPNDISDKAVFSAYQEHQKTQAQQAAAVPAGFKLVPVEPTEEMIVDGMQADVLGLPSIDDDSHVLSIFKAMLAAAPPSPVLPLSADQIRDAAKESGLDWQRGFVVDDTSNRYEDFARAIEAAHGITAHGAGGEST